MMQLLSLALPLFSPAAPVCAEDSLPSVLVTALFRSLLCSGHCSVLVTPGFSSTLPPWLQALKWFPKLDSAQLAQLQASLITAWFTKQRHVLFNS